jgi:exonuclease VII small subunit
MELTAIVSELKKERDRLNRAIAALEGTDAVKTGSAKIAAPALVVRKSKSGSRLSPEGRKRLSEMMKKRWAERRKKGTAGRKAA